jgi:hypothetical protein
MQLYVFCFWLLKKGRLLEFPRANIPLYLILELWAPVSWSIISNFELVLLYAQFGKCSLHLKYISDMQYCSQKKCKTQYIVIGFGHRRLPNWVYETNMD